MKSHPLIVLLTDFGTKDWYVGSMKGVILSRCPQAQLVDLTHEIPPHDVTAGAIALSCAAEWFPAHTIFIAVVDPGVGTHRASLAAYANKRYFIGPDNGLLSLCLQKDRRRKMIRLSERGLGPGPVSQTFHGRDIFAPAAAHLAGRKALSALGPPVKRIMPLALPPLVRNGNVLTGRVIYIDHFGNIMTNISGRYLESSGPARCAIIRYKRKTIPVVSSYAFADKSKLAALVNSSGMVELTLREKSAAWSVHSKIGDTVTCVLKKRGATRL